MCERTATLFSKITEPNADKGQGRHRRHEEQRKPRTRVLAAVRSRSCQIQEHSANLLRWRLSERWFLGGAVCGAWVRGR